MKLDAFEAIARALNESGVRYLVAGGVAVNAHGYARFTADLDLVIALDSTNILAAFAALAGLGYRPIVAITAEGFADAAERQRWIAEKGMQVLGFASDRHPAMSVDVFVYEPFDFAAEYAAAPRGELLPGLFVHYVSIPTLIRMKQAVGRPRDVDDIAHLMLIQEDRAASKEDGNE